MKNLRLWLLAHGLEVEGGVSGYVHGTRLFALVVNHHYVGVEVGFVVRPYVGVYDDELDTPHAEIAAAERDK